MSLRSYNNSFSPRFTSFVQDRPVSLLVPQTATDRVVVLGFSNSPTLPVMELTPFGADPNEVLERSYNRASAGNEYGVTASGEKFPSEISIAVEELITAGVTNIQVINLGADSRYRDVSARMSRERYIALENAYDLIAELPFHRIVPCNVVQGLNGDGLYNAAVYEVVYDKAAYDEYTDNGTDLTDPDDLLLLSGVPGYITKEEADFAKGSIDEVEDLAYQLANICFRVNQNGSMATGAVRTLNAIELSLIKKINLATGTAGVDWGTTGAASTAIAANTWAYAKNYNVPASGGYDFAVATTDADDVLAAIENIAYMAGKDATVVKGNLNLSAPATVTAATGEILNTIEWKLVYGVPTTSEINTFRNYLVDFGVNSTKYENGVVGFRDWNGVDANTIGDAAKYFRIYATTTSEKPVVADGKVTDDAAILDPETGAPYDIGWFIDCKVANHIWSNTSNTKKINRGIAGAPIAFTFLAGIGELIGIYVRNLSRRASTRTALTQYSAAFPISSAMASDLTQARFQIDVVEDGVFYTGRDITMGHWVNETIRTQFINRFTTNVVKDALDLARTEGKKIIGQPDSSKIKDGLKQKLEQEYARWANPEDGRLRLPALVRVYASEREAILGKVNIALTLPVSREILEVNCVVTVQE